MSVLSCARNGCENIMCDRLSHKFGYICDECFEELVAHGPEQDVADFMESRKSVYSLCADNAREKFGEEFVSR